ncbi:uncharacterized protein LOC108051144 isoform X1 [Drosophila rhopaloa]|nr:uncharacterized protein LOC108051144 isoform X1 [Drosophila rhopaloa]
MSEHEFEVKFRQWLDQEGIAREMHSHLRVELIHCFNNTALGQLLSKAAGVQMAHSHSLLLSPLAMMLHTLVAEFLHSQNCHFTLSVFCSETPHRHKLPDFGSRPEFRFQTEELQQVLTAVLGGQGDGEGEGEGEEPIQDPELEQIVVAHYEEDLAGQTQCLLLALVRSLVEIRRSFPVQRREEQEGEKDQEREPVKEQQKEQKKEQEKEQVKEEPPIPVILQDSSCQTDPAACLEARPEVDTSDLYQTEEHELVLGADGRSVFVGARVSQSLHSVEQQLGQLMKNVRQLAKSCAPPVEVISSTGFEELLKRELRERERLTKAGQAFNPGETVTKLAGGVDEREVEEEEEEPVAGDDVVYSDLGPIQLPVLGVAIPRLPRLHPEQLASLAVIRQSLEKVQRKARRPQGRMYVSVERMETLVGDVCGCVQLLGNVLNLSMEQEHAVGLHKGFQRGYREGFAHGHFMGLQEGQQQEQFERKKRERPPPEREDCSVQVEQLPTTSRAIQTTTQSSTRTSVHTQTDRKHLVDAWSQADLRTESQPKSYEQWIHEMLNSSSGQVFLERVELSLNKALELQKERLDELYQVKLRHQAEMLRLSRRQNSWRTLCKRVERDSQSSVEARDLVQKIFRLLEHYESHHHQLAEKIQQTEIAAEQAARILPMWTEGSVKGTAPGNWNSAMSSTLTSSGICTPVPDRIAIEAAAVEVDRPQEDRALVEHPYPGLGYPCQLLALAPPGGIPVAGTLVSVIPRLSGTFPKDPGLPLPLVTTSRTNNDPPTVARSVPAAEATVAHPIPSNSNPQAAEVAISWDYAREVPASIDSLPPENIPRDTVPVPPGPPPPDPPKPSMHSVATNTIAPLPLQLTPLKPSAGKSSQGPSFEEALLSAKSRMLQLERESDLLEQSFLSYLEKAKSTQPSAPKSTEESSKSRRMRSSCQRERDQMNRTLDGFRDWHRRVRKEDAVSLAQLEDLQGQRVVPGSVLDSKLSSPLWMSEQEEQDSYPFTNAITEARSKLLGEIMPARRTAAEEEVEGQGNWLPDLPPANPEVLNPIKRRSSNGEMSLLLRRAKEPLGRLEIPHPLLDTSSSSSSTLELPPLEAGRSTSSKLQQSMAKMQLLFGGGEPVKPVVVPIPQRRTTRPLSAPTPGSELGSGGMGEGVVLPPRPHTAPTVLHAINEQEPTILSLDSSTSSSSLRSAGAAFEDLVTGAVVAGGQHPQSSPEVSYSQAFWKRMNL